MRILGIDPGLGGAWAVVVDGVPRRCGDMPVAGEGSRRRVTASALAAIIGNEGPDLCVVELSWPRPTDGAASGFRFGTAFGIVLGVVGTLEVPLEMVAPQVWKRRFGLIGTIKDAARLKAIDLAPQLTSMLDRKRDGGRADAVLIGLYGAAAFGPLIAVEPGPLHLPGTIVPVPGRVVS